MDTTINGRFKLKLPPHRYEFYKNNRWEEARLNSMYENIGKDDVVYYAGAELGEMSALCQTWGAKVVNIEPNHTSWPCIGYIWGMNKLERPLYNFAGFASNVTQLEPKNPDLELERDIYHGHGWQNQSDGWPLFTNRLLVENHGFSELYQEADGLPQVKIDDLVEMIGVPPTVIIFDVEGSEWQVLRGSENVLTKYKPKLYASIHPEFMYAQWGEYSRNFRDWIIDRGYVETIIDYKHELHCLYVHKESA